MEEIARPTFYKRHKLKVEIRWSRRLNGGVNGMVLIQKENNESNEKYLESV